MEKNIVYKNKTISYDVVGTGEPVVLIHGVPADGSLWDNQVAFLANRYRIITPSLPGSGKSAPADNMSIDGMAAIIKNILDGEKISQAVIIGHSIGGYVSMALSDNYPEVVKALGLFHSSSYADSEEKKEARKKNISSIKNHGSYEFIKETLPALFCDAFRKEHSGSVEEMIEKYKNINPGSLAAYQQAMIDRPDRRNVLKKIVNPVLFIMGEYDKAIPLQDSLEQCHIPALSYIHILKNSGHFGMLEEVERSNKVLEMFLEDVC